MIQDIYPSKLKNEFRNEILTDEDPVFIFNAEGKTLLKITEGQVVFPTGKDLKGSSAIYLFSVDDTKYFLARGCEGPKKDGSTPGDEGAQNVVSAPCSAGPQTENSAALCEMLQKQDFAPYSVREARDCISGKEVYAIFTAYHLWKWYTDNIYCGKCASELEPDTKERALRCPKCGNIIYPRINPAVIVGVTKGDCLLITRYRTGYNNNALVAGFTEIGETLEETVAREVMEETGVKVKNIRYYKSQPWGMAQDILVGYYCEADGDARIKMDADELKYAEWVKREDIVLQPNNLSLTNEMMLMFKEGREQSTVKSLQLQNDDYLGHVEHIRHACRGILVKDGKVLLSYESNNGKYIIPGGGVEEGETYAECCEREILEETGMKVKAVKCYLEIQEMFLDWNHINHYFVCELVEDTGKKHLTEAEERAGCCCAWKDLSEALDIFGCYEDYHKTDIAVYGLYRREYTALKEFEALEKMKS